MNLKLLAMEFLGAKLREFATADFSSAALVYLILFAASAYCCIEGYRFYRVALMVGAFIFGFIACAKFMLFFHLDEKLDTGQLLMTELIVGGVAALFSFKIFLMGVFAVAYQLAAQNLPEFFDGLYRPLVSTVGAGIAGFLCVRMTRLVIIALTSIIGGVTMVYAFVEFLRCVIPAEMALLPPANSVIWLAAKVFFSVMGFMRQNKNAPKD